MTSVTRTYGNGRFTGSIELERRGKLIFVTPDEKSQKDDVEVFCPFIGSDNEKRLNHKYQSIVLRSIKDLDNHINAGLAESVDALDSKPSGQP